jgi:hypothetical protein
LFLPLCFIAAMTTGVKIEIRMPSEVILSVAEAQRFAGRGENGSARTRGMRVNQGK